MNIKPWVLKASKQVHIGVLSEAQEKKDRKKKKNWEGKIDREGPSVRRTNDR